MAERSAEWMSRAVRNYVRDRLYRETEGKRGAAASIVRATGLTSAHIANARRGKSGVGEDAALALAVYWGLKTRSGLEEKAFEWYEQQEAAGNVDAEGNVPQPDLSESTEKKSEPAPPPEPPPASVPRDVVVEPEALEPEIDEFDDVGDVRREVVRSDLFRKSSKAVQQEFLGLFNASGERDSDFWYTELLRLRRDEKEGRL